MIYDWLSAPDPSSNYKKALDDRHTGTGIWFVTSKEFVDWKNNCNSFLWLYGIPGSGKSTLAATVVENVMDDCRLASDMAAAYFYFDFADHAKQQCENMIRSLITQLAMQSMHMPHALSSLYSTYSSRKIQLTLSALLSTLHEIIEQFQNVFIILDAWMSAARETSFLQLWKIFLAGNTLGFIF
jgi:flagellin-specific chaperone FliS